MYPLVFVQGLAGLVHPLNPLTYSPTLTHPLTRSPTHSLTHSLTHALTHRPAVEVVVASDVP